MAGKRQALANVTNAANSPFRTGTAPTGKRTRAQDSKDAEYGQPPAKKQIVEISDDDAENVDPKRKNGFIVQGKMADAFPKRQNSNHNTPTAFERKLAAAREKKPASQQRAAERPQKTEWENLETVRQWQRHYRRQFPDFVFYFESVPEELRLKVASQIRSLGAREEKFFSKSVTHIITTRPVPAELKATSPTEDVSRSSTQPATVQPSALSQDTRKTTNILDANLQRRGQSQHAHVALDVDFRKPGALTVDVLSRARELGIKIWQLEKLQRILKTILETNTGDRSIATESRPTTAASKTNARPSKNHDLEQLLRNEKVNGPADRDMTVAAQDMTAFKGCYLYIHDMDERTRPVMVRDYNRPAHKEEGKWPQFRLTQPGRCPFVEDPAHTEKLRKIEQAKQEQAEREEDERWIDVYDPATGRIEPYRRRDSDLQHEREKEQNLRRSPRKLAQQQQQPRPAFSKPLEPPKQIPAKRQSSGEGAPALFGSAQQSLRGPARMIGGEPVASGMQPSNVTSAIRSNAVSSTAISSTAAGINRRVGDSKEVSALKRKVLERGANITSNQSMPSSYMNDVRAAINDDNNRPSRAAKRRAQETLGVVKEDVDEHKEQRRAVNRKPAPKKRKPAQKEAKPGYCENCRDKFDDFEEHCLSRKHRKFAQSPENWADLDALLSQLKRPRKAAAC